MNSHQIVAYFKDKIKQTAVAVGDGPLDYAYTSKGSAVPKIIHYAQPHHQGVYTVTASNALGSSKIAVYVLVKGKIMVAKKDSVQLLIICLGVVILHKLA